MQTANNITLDGRRGNEQKRLKKFLARTTDDKSDKEGTSGSMPFAAIVLTRPGNAKRKMFSVLLSTPDYFDKQDVISASMMASLPEELRDYIWSLVGPNTLGLASLACRSRLVSDRAWALVR
jgi:hypothetical protein